jgi:CubicO group peptidase (beta-lactamase class C family)
LDETTACGETPCALALLWRHDEEEFLYASGHADLGRNTPICRDSIFRLYSLTKPHDGVAAMTLVERGV